MRAARDFLRAPLLRCSAPDFTALSMRETSVRNSSSARVASPLADRRFQPAEPGLDLRGAAPILETLALRPMNPLFL